MGGEEGATSFTPCVPPWGRDLTQAGEAPQRDPPGRRDEVPVGPLLSWGPRLRLCTGTCSQDCHKPGSPAFSLIEPAWISLLQVLLCKYI